MKRRELVKLLEDNGWYIKRNGGNHSETSRYQRETCKKHY